MINEVNGNRLPHSVLSENDVQELLKKTHRRNAAIQPDFNPILKEKEVPASSNSLRDTLFKMRSAARKVNLIAYIRCEAKDSDPEERLNRLKEYCDKRGYTITQVFTDQGRPSFGLSEALEALKQADGLVAVDLDSFVEHPVQRLRDLRPFLNNFLSQPNQTHSPTKSAKRLIVLEEGIDTGSLAGQAAAIDLMRDLKDPVESSLMAAELWIDNINNASSPQ
jgi:hypothetical protein